MTRWMLFLLIVTIGCERKESSQTRKESSQTPPKLSKSQEIVKASEPFARELKNLRRAVEIGIESADLNARVVKLAEALDTMQDVAMDSKEGADAIRSGRSVVENFQEAAKRWTASRQENDAFRAMNLDLRESYNRKLWTVT